MDFCHLSVNRAVELRGMQCRGSSSNVMRTGSETPSPKAIA
jgi:hypothetical protein